MKDVLARAWRWARFATAHEPFWLELVSGIVTVGWVMFVFWMPLDLADRQPYLVLAMLASDETWEMIGGLLGVAQLFMAIWKCRSGRWIAAFLLAWWWWVLALGLYLGNTSAPGVVLYAGQGLANLIPVLLLYRPAYRAKRCARG